MASLYRLTVYEHLWFFARLKNQPEDGLSEQTEQLIMASLYRLTVYEHLWFFARLKN